MTSVARSQAAQKRPFIGIESERLRTTTTAVIPQYLPTAAPAPNAEISAWYGFRVSAPCETLDRTIGREPYELGPCSMKAPVVGLPQ